MVILLRRRLDCFYCGKKSIQRYAPGLPKWKCENCEATNHLDAHGNITDPPAAGESPAMNNGKRFGRQAKRSVSPTIPAPEQSLFCRTCLNNQYLVTQNLANYLPPPSDPRYAEYEAAYPTYRKSLEDRYPQVCEECEPKVRQQIKATGYIAKTDHLRRMMDRTRNAASLKGQWTPGLVITMLGFVFWILGTIAYLIWNGFGAISRAEPGLLEDPSETNIFRCTGQAVAFGQADDGCVGAAYPLAGWAVFFTFLSIWWNPILRRRWIDRAIGLREFYKLQLIIAMTRCATWYFLGYNRELSFDPRVVQAIHATMLAFNVIVPVVTYRTARIGKSPRISFQENYEPLVQPKQRSDPANVKTFGPSPPNSQNSLSPPPPTFPFHKLSSRDEQEAPQYQPPTPPPEEDEPDAMDVDSPQRTYNLTPSIHRQSQVMQPVQPSPFYGKLPPAPISQEHRLRNPPNRPSFQKASPEQQEKFFQSMTGHRSNGIEDYANPSKRKPDFIMREQRLFTQRDREDAETGLEAWFSDFFSLGEVPKSAAQPAHKVTQDTTPRNPYKSELNRRIIPVLLLFFSLCMWNSAPRWPSISIYIYFSCIGIAAVVATTHLKGALSSTHSSHSDLLLCLLELLGAVAFSYEIRQAVMLDFNIHEALNPFPYWFLGFMLVQESMAFITTLRLDMREDQRIISEARAHQGEYVTLQTQPMRRDERSPSRERRPLPLDDGIPFTTQSMALTQMAPQTPARTPATMSFFEQRFTRSQAKPKNSPGSNAFSGLSLDNNGPSAGLRKSARTLRRGPNPWEVGGM